MQSLYGKLILRKSDKGERRWEGKGRERMGGEWKRNERERR